jgi:hypothetical protein
MAITKEEIQTAVQRYLPTTVNFAKSADLGEYNRDVVFQKIHKVLLTSLLTDGGTVFYLIFLTAQRLIVDVQLCIDLLDELADVEHLKGVVSVEATRIDDLSELTAARGALLQLSGSLTGGSFGVVHFDNYNESINNFLTDQVVDNIQGGNKPLLAANIRATMEGLASAWERVRVRRARLFGILNEYQNTDLRATVAEPIISSILESIQTLESTLPTLPTSDQAEQSEAILIDLVAGKAALRVIGNAPPVVGETVAGPAFGGRTPNTYLEVTGNAVVQPLNPALEAEDGKMALPDVLAASVNGQTFDLGEDFTRVFFDPTAAFLTAGVEEDMTLTLVDRGLPYVITAVNSEVEVEVTPAMANRPGVNQRYAITKESPGVFFESPGAVFWDEYSNGGTASTQVLAGTQGSFLRQDKVAGTDGTNLKAEGTTAELRPYTSNGSDGTVPDILDLKKFISASGTFLSDQVAPGTHVLYITAGTNSGGPYAIDSVDSETQLTLVGALTLDLSGDPYYIELASGAGSKIRDPNATFLTSGLANGDQIEILSGTYIGNTYTIDSVESQTELTLASAPFAARETPESWEVLYPNNVLVSAAEIFLGVAETDDIIKVNGINYTVDTVDGLNQLTIQETFPGKFENATFFIFASETDTQLFRADDVVDFQVTPSTPIRPGLGTTIEVVEQDINGDPVSTFKPGIINVDGTDYSIDRLDPDDPAQQLFVSEVATVSAGPLSWAARAGDETKTFLAAFPGPFLDPKYESGQTIVVRPGAEDEFRVNIDTIEDAETVIVTGPIEESLGPVDYAIIAGEVTEGTDLLVAGRRFNVLEVVNATTLKVDPPVPNSMGVAVEYSVVRTNAQLLSNRLLDPLGAADFDAAQGSPGIGFDTGALSGARVDIFAKGNLTTSFVLAFDNDDPADGFNEGFEIEAFLEPGQREVGYKILTDIEGDSREFRAASGSGAAANDVLTVWDISGPFDIVNSAPGVGPPPDEVPEDVYIVGPRIEAGLEDQLYVVVRGGDPDHGRYLILDYLNNSIDLPDDTETLRVRVAEVLLDFGENLTTIVTSLGSTGSISDDGDDDGFSGLFSHTGDEDLVALGVERGDRLVVGTAVSFVEEVVDSFTLIVSPELAEVGDQDWSISRNSVTFSLKESYRLRDLMAELLDALDSYDIAPSASVLSVLESLRSNQMDRAIDLLSDGEIDEFISLTADRGSYASKARSDLQTLGRTTSASVATQANVGGTAPSESITGSEAAATVTGESVVRPGSRPQNSSSGGTAPLTGNAAGAAADPIPGSEVETRVAMADGIRDIVADERIRAVAQISFEEVLNRGIFQLTGEVESDVLSDQDPTLPWIAKSGSLKDRIESREAAMVDAIQYMIDNPDKFDENQVIEEDEDES